MKSSAITVADFFKTKIFSRADRPLRKVCGAPPLTGTTVHGQKLKLGQKYPGGCLVSVGRPSVQCSRSQGSGDPVLGVRLMLGKIRVNVRRVSGPWKAAWPRGQAAVQGRKFKAQFESGVAAWPAFIRLPATVSPQSVVSGVTLPSAWLHYAKRFPTKLPQFALTVKMHNMIKLTMLNFKL